MAFNWKNLIPGKRAVKLIVILAVAGVVFYLIREKYKGVQNRRAENKKQAEAKVAEWKAAETKVLEEYQSILQDWHQGDEAAAVKKINEMSEDELKEYNKTLEIYLHSDPNSRK